MKTLSITIGLVMVLVTTSVLATNYSTNYSQGKEQTIHIKINTAIQDPDLVQQMYIQLDDDFLFGEFSTKVYTKSVFYNGNQYLITGTYNEWMEFFLMDL